MAYYGILCVLEVFCDKKGIFLYKGWVQKKIKSMVLDYLEGAFTETIPLTVKYKHKGYKYYLVEKNNG